MSTLSGIWINPYWPRILCQEITSYCPIREISWVNHLLFVTFNACHNIYQNSTKKNSLHKHWHSLSINRLLYHVDHLGTCHYQLMQSWNLLYEKRLQIHLEQSYPSAKVCRVKSLATFRTKISGIGLYHFFKKYGLSCEVYQTKKEFCLLRQKYFLLLIMRNSFQTVFHQISVYWFRSETHKSCLQTIH